MQYILQKTKISQYFLFLQYCAALVYNLFRTFITLPHILTSLLLHKRVMVSLRNNGARLSWAMQVRGEWNCICQILKGASVKKLSWEKDDPCNPDSMLDQLSGLKTGDVLQENNVKEWNNLTKSEKIHCELLLLEVKKMLSLKFVSCRSWWT